MILRKSSRVDKIKRYDCKQQGQAYTRNKRHRDEMNERQGQKAVVRDSTANVAEARKKMQRYSLSGAEDQLAQARPGRTVACFSGLLTCRKRTQTLAWTAETGFAADGLVSQVLGKAFHIICLSALDVPRARADHWIQ